MRTVKVNGEALKLYLEDKGITPKEVNEKLHRSSNFLNQVIRTGNTSEASYYSICNALEVPYERFLIKEEEKEELPQISEDLGPKLDRIADLLEGLCVVLGVEIKEPQAFGKND